jgi:hypothetical protein
MGTPRAVEIASMNAVESTTSSVIRERTTRRISGRAVTLAGLVGGAGRRRSCC